MLEGSVALALFLEVLEGVGGAAHGVGHFGGLLCCWFVVDVKYEVRGEVVIFGPWYQAEAISVTGMVLCVIAARDSGSICVNVEITGTNKRQ